MTVEHNKSVAKKLFDLLNEGDLDAADSLIAINYVWHDASKRLVLGLDGFKRRVRSVQNSLSGYHATIEDLLAEGDKVIVRYTAQGRHKGLFLGVAPTDKLVTYSGIFIWRLVDGKVAEEWTSWDALGILQQLRAAPAPMCTHAMLQ